ncbi:MAG: hypothetical protein WC657_03995 [Candidatus Paceibacterota bacterium]|jgi:hypothetical protein
MEDLEKTSGNGFQSYNDVDPKKQLTAVEARLKEINDMPELNQDIIDERKKLESIVSNLMSNGDPRS